MINTTCTVEGNILTIQVDLSQRQGLSKSGDTVIIASSQGNQKIGQGDVTMGITVYTKEGIEPLQKQRAESLGYKTWLEYKKALKGAG